MSARLNKMPTSTTSTGVRLPNNLVELLKAKSEQTGKSRNVLIVEAVQQSLVEKNSKIKTA